MVGSIKCHNIEQTHRSQQSAHANNVLADARVLSGSELVTVMSCTFMPVIFSAPIRSGPLSN